MMAISSAALDLLADLAIIPQVVGYDHRVRELDEAIPRLIEWMPGHGYIASQAGRDVLTVKTA